MWLARIHVTLKPVVNDPQGLAIQGGLRQLGFESVRSVRAGKLLEVQLDVSGRDEAARLATEMCRKLLANPVIEDFSFELQERAEPPGAPASG
jgi:phosphoribosylformylglycinamidine synthase